MVCNRTHIGYEWLSCIHLQNHLHNLTSNIYQRSALHTIVGSQNLCNKFLRSISLLLHIPRNRLQGRFVEKTLWLFLLHPKHNNLHIYRLKGSGLPIEIGYSNRLQEMLKVVSKSG